MRREKGRYTAPLRWISWQAALCAGQSAVWQAVLQYRTRRLPLAAPLGRLPRPFDSSARTMRTGAGGTGLRRVHRHLSLGAGVCLKRGCTLSQPRRGQLLDGRHLRHLRK